MTLARRLLILVVLSFVIPYFAGFGVIFSMISVVAIAGIAKAILSVRGGITGEMEIDLGGHLPAAHHGHHGHGEHHEGHGEHDAESSHGEHHEAHGGHAVEEEPPKRVVVKAPIWKVDPRWFLLLPGALLSLTIVEAGLYWLAVKGLRTEWTSNWAMIPPAVLGLVTVSSRGFVRTFNGKAAVRFLGRWLILSSKPGQTRLFFFDGLFEVVEIPLVYPDKPEKKQYGPYAIRDGEAGAAEIVVDSVVQISSSGEDNSAIRTAIFGGIEAVYGRIINAVDAAFERLAADAHRPPFTYEEAIERESFDLFESAARSIDASRLGVQVGISEIFVDGTDEIKTAAKAVFLQDKRNAARVAAATADVRLKEMLMKARSEGGAGMKPEEAQRWIQTRVDLGGTGDVQYTDEAGDPDRQIRTADRRARKASRRGGDQ